MIKAIEEFAAALAGHCASVLSTDEAFILIMPPAAFDQLTGDVARSAKHEPRPSYMGIVDNSSRLVGAFCQVKIATPVGYVLVRRGQPYRLGGA